MAGHTSRGGGLFLRGNPGVFPTTGEMPVPAALICPWEMLAKAENRQLSGVVAVWVAWREGERGNWNAATSLFWSIKPLRPLRFLHVTVMVQPVW